MGKKKWLVVCGTLVWGIAAVAAEACSASGSLVYLDSDASSLWRTVRGHELTLPVVYPDSATSASLKVCGVRYRRVHENVPAGDFVLTLPGPTSPESENVYELTLTFDDGTVRTAKVGVVQGTSIAGEGSTRCVFDTSSSDWSTFVRQAVMPVPAGATSLKVNDVTVETGLAGAAGWYALAAGRDTMSAKVELSTPEADYLVYLTGTPLGLLLMLR